MGRTIEFNDIRIRAALPLHPFLARHPRLLLRLATDGRMCGNTTEVNGDLVVGVWDFKERLRADLVKQSLTMTVLTGASDPGIQVVTVTLGVAELLARVKAYPNKNQEFDIFDSGTPIQLKLSMTCSVKINTISGGVPQTTGDTDQTVDRRTKNAQSHRGSNSSELPSRETLESAYTNIICLPSGDERKARELSLLGVAYLVLYTEGHDEKDLDRSIVLHEEALQCSGPLHPQLAERSHHFAIALMSRFQQSGNISDIERSISNFETALKFTKDFDLWMPDRLGHLGTAFQVRFNRLGDLADLENAISNLQKVPKLTPDGHPDKPNLLDTLGNALEARFKRLGNLADLDAAVLNKRKAVQLTPDGRPNKPAVLASLGTTLKSHFGQFGNLSVLEDAISDLRKAVQLTPDGHPDKPGRLSKLGFALVLRFSRLNDLTDLEESISNLQQAAEWMPDDHSDKPFLFSRLGSALRIRFDHLGSLKDLEDAIPDLRKAVELTPDGHHDKPGRLSNLGAAFVLRFNRLRSLEDLHHGIQNLEKAAQLTPDGHAASTSIFGNLGNALEARFYRLGNLADSEDAISNQRQAVQLTPDGHQYKSNWLTSLGNALESRFTRLGSLIDLEEAITNKRRAVELTPGGHTAKPSQLNNLGNALRARFDRLGNLVDLQEAISNLQKAVKLAPNGHPDEPLWLYNLGNALFARYKHLNNSRDLENALSAYSTAAKSNSGSALMRFNVARTWAEVSDAEFRSPLEAFNCAIDLLPRIAWVGLAVTDQHALLADVGGIVRDAVATAIKHEEYETAVVWAEQGRSIVWQNLLGLRSPVEDLREKYPDLADRLRSIAQRLEGSGSQDVALVETPTGSAGDAATNYSKWAIEWDDLVNEIRDIPQFEGFLRTKRFSQLAAAAYEGPVIILNVNNTGCDALVLTVDDSPERRVSAENIPLERFSYEKGKNMFRQLTELLSSAGVRERNDRKTGRTQSSAESNVKFKVILGILWRDVVKPVIKGLALQTQSERPPRIWWCATGLLAFLPIHAAGLYDTEEIGEKLSDYAVSSYTPTLTAILELSDPVVRDDFQVLTVAQASAPGAQPIPKTEDEVKIVHGLTAGARRVNLTGANATVQCVQEAMLESNWIHLACHGQQNAADAMSSGFLLHDRTLKLSEIVKMKLPKADFAFLSACQTAMGDEKVAEESVHLAAGMLLSGCRGVIATTWSIQDDDAPMIAEEVYSRMFKDGRPNRKEAAYALHEAVKVLRNSGAQCVSWVPFIHIGR